MSKETVEKSKIDKGMIDAGLAYGHSVSKLHPKMKPFIDKVKDGVQLIDLNKTVEKLDGALKVFEEAKKEGKVVLFVGTKPTLRELVKQAAKDLDSFYVVDRWIGGLLTNFSEIKKRLTYYKELEAKTKEEGYSKNYTKKERLQIEKEIKKLEIKFGGVKEMTKLPDIVFVTDIKRDPIAVKEANEKGIKVVAIVDTNVDPTMVDYMIPANDDAISSVGYILDKVVKVLK